MLETRVMPCLLCDDGALYKTVKFRNPNYVGDPINAIKIFNEKEVDELILLDITASEKKKHPDFELIENIASECFMPLCYGGGIKSVDQIRKILSIGVEKVAVNSGFAEKPEFVAEACKLFGSQAIIVSIDIKKNLFGKYKVVVDRGKKALDYTPVDYAIKAEEIGCGELMITSVDREGTWEGYQLDILADICSAVSIPVIANGGAGCVNDLVKAKEKSGVSALALGSMSVYQKKGMGVLINFPERGKLDNMLDSV